MTGYSPQVDTYMVVLPKWQMDFLTAFRNAVHTALPEVREAMKWNVPVFVYNETTLFAMSGFKEHTKYNFIHNGALLDDPGKLFNNGFDSKKSRGIDRREGESLDDAALLDLIREAATKL